MYYHTACWCLAPAGSQISPGQWDEVSNAEHGATIDQAVPVLCQGGDNKLQENYQPLLSPSSQCLSLAGER